jgi:hypothetical protein
MVLRFTAHFRRNYFAAGVVAIFVLLSSVDLFHFHSLYVMSSIPMENLSLKKEAALDRFYNALQHYLQTDSKNTHSVDYILFTRESASSNICCTIIFENDQFILTTSTISEND